MASEISLLRCDWSIDSKCKFKPVNTSDAKILVSFPYILNHILTSNFPCYHNILFILLLLFLEHFLQNGTDPFSPTVCLLFAFSNNILDADSCKIFGLYCRNVSFLLIVHACFFIFLCIFLLWTLNRNLTFAQAQQFARHQSTLYFSTCLCIYVCPIPCACMCVCLCVWSYLL